MWRPALAARYRAAVDPIDVVVLGDANPDLILRGGDLGPISEQREALAESATFAIGGSGAIFASAAARLGLRVAIAAVVGDDLFGRFIRERLEARGVDTRGLIARGATPTGVSVILSRPGDRGIYTVLGSMAELDSGAIDPELLGAAGHVHVTSYFLQHRLRPDLPRLLHRARSSGATTSLDPNWDPTERWDAGLKDLLSDVDVFLPNGAEAVRIAGVSDVDTAAEVLADRGHAVAVKLGDRGALARQGDEAVRVGPVGSEIVDTTGAGDAFDAGFVSAFVHGRPLARALAMANACGALSCRSVGGVDGQPTFKEALAVIDRDRR